MSNAIKVGIWGTGRAGNNMPPREMANYSGLFDIVAGCDVDPERRKAFEEKAGGKVYENEEAFFADPEVELVSVATRSPEHVEHALKALNANKYALTCTGKTIHVRYIDPEQELPQIDAAGVPFGSAFGGVPAERTFGKKGERSVLFPQRSGQGYTNTNPGRKPFSHGF